MELMVEASDVGYNSFLVISRIGPGLRFEMKMVRDLGKMYLELVISLLGFEGIVEVVDVLVEHGELLYDEM
jgi:hypothetical protein